MIKSITVKNFKSFVDETIDFSNLTLLAGLNSSGKSTITQALRMYSQSSSYQLPLLVGHGGVDEIRSKYSSSGSDIEIILNFPDGQDRLVVSNDKIIRPEKGPVFMYVGADRLGPQPNLPIEQVLHNSPSVGDKGQYVLSFIQHLDEQGYLVPEELLKESSASQTYIQVLQDWLAEITPGVTFGTEHFKTADTSYAKIDGFRPTNVGFGLSYTLPIIAAALGFVAYPSNLMNNEEWVTKWEENKKNNGVLLILENPEAHLHPKGQTAIGRLLALCAKKGVQIIVETHSEHIMDGIRIAIKQGFINYNEVIFHYLTKNSKGLSEIKTPVIDENAKLNSWPEGFFDQTLKNRAFLSKRK